MKYKVWKCEIVIADSDLPSGFDFPPRSAAINAVEKSGFPVLVCFSGWGDSLTPAQEIIVETLLQPGPEGV